MPPTNPTSNNNGAAQGALGQPPAASGSSAQQSQTPPLEVAPEMCMDTTSGYYGDFYRASSLPPPPAAPAVAYPAQAGAPIQLQVQLWEGGSFPGELIPMIEIGSTTVRRGQVLEVPPSGIEVVMPDGHRWQVTRYADAAIVTDMSSATPQRALLRPATSHYHVPFEMNYDGDIIFKPELEHLGRDVLQVRFGVGAGHSEINYIRAGSVIPVANRGMTEVTAFDGETIRYTKYNGNVYRLSPTGDLLTPFGTNVETISVGGRVAVRFSPAQPAPPPAPEAPSGPTPPSFDELFLAGEVRQVRMPAPRFDGTARTVVLEPGRGLTVMVSPLSSDWAVSGTLKFLVEQFTVKVGGTDITVRGNSSGEFTTASGTMWQVRMEGGELVFTQAIETPVVGTTRATPGSFFPLRGMGLGRGITYTKDGRTNTLYVRQDANGRRELICRYNSGDNSRFVGYESPAPQEFQFTKSCGQLGVIYRPDIPEPRPSWVIADGAQEYRIGQTADGTLWQESSSGGTDRSLRQCQEGERFGPYAVKNGDLVLVDQPPQIVSDIRAPAASTRYIRAQETYIYNIEPNQQVEIMAGEESYIISRSQDRETLTAQRGSGPVETSILTSNDRIVIRRAGQPLEAAVPLENFSGESFQVRRASPDIIEISLRPQPVAHHAGAPFEGVLTMEDPGGPTNTGTFEEGSIEDTETRQRTRAQDVEARVNESNTPAPTFGDATRFGLVFGGAVTMVRDLYKALILGGEHEPNEVESTTAMIATGTALDSAMGRSVTWGSFGRLAQGFVEFLPAFFMTSLSNGRSAQSAGTTEGQGVVEVANIASGAVVTGAGAEAAAQVSAVAARQAIVTEAAGVQAATPAAARVLTSTPAMGLTFSLFYDRGVALGTAGDTYWGQALGLCTSDGTDCSISGWGAEQLHTVVDPVADAANEYVIAPVSAGVGAATSYVSETTQSWYEYDADLLGIREYTDAAGRQLEEWYEYDAALVRSAGEAVSGAISYVGEKANEGLQWAGNKVGQGLEAANDAGIGVLDSAADLITGGEYEYDPTWLDEIF